MQRLTSMLNKARDSVKSGLEIVGVGEQKDKYCHQWDVQSTLCTYPGPPKETDSEKGPHDSEEHGVEQREVVHQPLQTQGLHDKLDRADENHKLQDLIPKDDWNRHSTASDW